MLIHPIHPPIHMMYWKLAQCIEVYWRMYLMYYFHGRMYSMMYWCVLNHARMYHWVKWCTGICIGDVTKDVFDVLRFGTEMAGCIVRCIRCIELSQDVFNHVRMYQVMYCQWDMYWRCNKGCIWCSEIWQDVLWDVLDVLNWARMYCQM